jgi:hypothetical protein
MQTLYIKQPGMLIAADDLARQLLAKIPNGTTVTAEPKVPRNVKHHRMFFALMTLVHENLPERSSALYPTVENLVDAMKLATGHYETIRLPNGKTGFKLKSISFAKLDQTQFNEFFDRCCNVIAEHFIPGLPAGKLRSEVELMIGARAA